MRAVLFFTVASFSLTIGLAWLLFLPIAALLSAYEKLRPTTFSVVNLLVVALAATTVAWIGCRLLDEPDVFSSKLTRISFWIGALAGAVQARITMMGAWEPSSTGISRERRGRSRL